MEKITNTEVANTYVQSASDILTGTAQQNKAVFDQLPLLIVSKYNGMYDYVKISNETIEKYVALGMPAN